MLAIWQDDHMKTQQIPFCIDPGIGSVYLSPSVGGLALIFFSITVFWWITKHRAFAFCIIYVHNFNILW